MARAEQKAIAKKEKKEKKEKDPNAPKRPKSAYMEYVRRARWRQRHRARWSCIAFSSRLLVCLRAA